MPAFFCAMDMTPFPYDCQQSQKNVSNIDNSRTQQNTKACQYPPGNILHQHLTQVQGNYEPRHILRKIGQHDKHHIGGQIEKQ